MTLFCPTCGKGLRYCNSCGGQRCLCTMNGVPEWLLQKRSTTMPYLHWTGDQANSVKRTAVCDE